MAIWMYCNQYVDKDASMYLMLANEILHFFHPNIITIAEDATFYPGLCEPTSQGGLGFDYYVNLSASEMWSSLLESTPDHEWSMSKIISVLLGNRQYANKMIIYAENHNQSISGGRSLAEILLGQGNEQAPLSDELLRRGSSLIKMIKLITFTVGGRGYLNFMGNEFGHPKRVEFPMPSNKFSFSLANRCWDLLDKEGVYRDLFCFDKDLMKLDENERLLSRRLPTIHHVNDSNMVISYIRGPFLFIFNFHPSNSYQGYCVGVDEAGEYQAILNTDEIKYGGQGFIKEEQYLQRTISRRVDGQQNCLEVPLPSRTAQVDSNFTSPMNQFFPKVDADRYTYFHAPPISYNHVNNCPSPSPSMVASIAAVERILNYSFRNKRLLEEALTHPSYSDSASYQRLEFLGDAVLGLAFTNHVFLVYPKLEPGQLSLIRAANISTEKLARVAIKHRLFQFVRQNATGLDDKVREFAEAVSQEEDAISYGGSIKAPKVLADIVESLAAAVYVDINFDLIKLWEIIGGLLEPIATLEDLQQQPQPVTVLFEHCQKLGKHVDIKHWKKGLTNITSVYVDGEFVASGSSEQKQISKLNAVKGALHKLSQSMSAKIDADDGINEPFEIEGAKQKLHELCCKKKWERPIYQLEKDEGPPHEKKFVSSVKVPTVDGILYITGDEKARVKEAENSAASFMIRALQESNYL
ncbi:hypothetical protein COLO4_09700 [Corchorus olitorius]|uniref:Double-stranded RNA-binding protein n=1 Tax=Corchorus olitorius TaxID=93759 RepID=A0A1R3KBC3_9ROSI|nr:hypothetical protein COLO4_09700 [Corchorus olitorius]